MKKKKQKESKMYTQTYTVTFVVDNEKTLHEVNKIVKQHLFRMAADTDHLVEKVNMDL